MNSINRIVVHKSNAAPHDEGRSPQPITIRQATRQPQPSLSPLPLLPLSPSPSLSFSLPSSPTSPSLQGFLPSASSSCFLSDIHAYVSASPLFSSSDPLIPSTDRIHSWAKAHAFPNRSLPSDSPPQNQDSQSHNAASPGEQNAHVTGRDRNPQPAGSSQHHDPEKPKPGLLPRLKNGVIRFGRHAKTTLLHSWLNVLLVFVPVGIAVEAAHMSPTIIFSMNAIAIVPLASLLSHATECVACRMGDTIGALTNVTFGNAVELIIM